MAGSLSHIVTILFTVFLEVQWISKLHVQASRYHYDEDLKYILFWPQAGFGALHEQPPGTIGFDSCPVSNCYLSYDMDYFRGDLKKFDAIAFVNWCTMNEVRYRDLPSKRYPHQLYIFLSLESQESCPVCLRMYDNFFNWTMTFRFDSDTPILYFTIYNVAEEIVGPRKNMRWEIDFMSRNFTVDIHQKRKAAAWFVTNCYDRSNRMLFTRRLQGALHKYGLKVDIYGDCGTLRCPKENHKACMEKLKREYYFYLALENSFSEDYVTEKVLNAIQNDVVPIVYGAANYSRFLPPGSYLDGRKLGPHKLASKMYRLIKFPYLYQQYFKWKAYYTYKEAEKQNICKICDALNQNFTDSRIIKHFRKWWHPQFVNLCM